MRTALAGGISDFKPPAPATQEERERLASLGYLAGGAAVPESGSSTAQPARPHRELRRGARGLRPRGAGQGPGGGARVRSRARGEPRLRGRAHRARRRARPARPLPRVRGRRTARPSRRRRSSRSRCRSPSRACSSRWETSRRPARPPRRRSEPRDDAAHELLASVALAGGSLDEAEREAALVTSDPGALARAAVVRAEVAARRGHPEQALERLDAVRARSASLGPVPWLEFVRGDVLARLGRHEQAEAALRAEIQAFPNHARAYASLAIVRALRGAPLAESRRVLVEMSRAAPGPGSTALAARALAFIGDDEGSAGWRRGQVLRSRHPPCPREMKMALARRRGGPGAVDRPGAIGPGLAGRDRPARRQGHGRRRSAARGSDGEAGARRPRRHRAAQRREGQVGDPRPDRRRVGGGAVGRRLRLASRDAVGQRGVRGGPTLEVRLDKARAAAVSPEAVGALARLKPQSGRDASPTRGASTRSCGRCGPTSPRASTSRWASATCRRRTTRGPSTTWRARSRAEHDSLPLRARGGAGGLRVAPARQGRASCWPAPIPPRIESRRHRVQLRRRAAERRRDGAGAAVAEPRGRARRRLRGRLLPARPRVPAARPARECRSDLAKVVELAPGTPQGEMARKALEQVR